MYFVSVIIPTYNREKFIEKAIHSVLTQTYQEFEVIVVDDGSTDNTSDIISSISGKDQRIRYLKQDINYGAQAARIVGVKAASGDMIAFLDSDDEWYPDKLMKQIAAFKSLSDSVGVVHGDCDIYYEDTGEKKRYMVPKLNGYVYEELLRKPGPMYQCMLVRRKCFEDIPDAIDRNVPSFQEWDTSINLANKYDFYFIDEPLMVYNIHKGDTISKDSLRGIKGYYYVVEKHRNKILKYCGQKALGNHYYWLAMRYYMDMKDNFHSREFFKRARKCGVEDIEIKTFIHIAAVSPILAIRLQMLKNKFIFLISQTKLKFGKVIERIKGLPSR